MAKFMVPSRKEERKIKFAVEEIVLSFLGALVLAFGALVLKISQKNGTDWASFILVVFIVWLGLLLFTVPIVRKIEQLM